MGIEYYLIKPEKKEIFYLAKHFCGFNKIPSMTYKDSLLCANYPEYEDWQEFLWDTLTTNWDYFLNCDITLEQVSDIIHQIYEWTISDKVILDNDCSETFNLWKDWNETGSITKILEKLHRKPKGDNNIFQQYLEDESSIIFENPSYNSSIIGITVDGRVVYDQELMIKELCEKDNINYEEALEFIEYNTMGSLPQSESKYPIIIYKKENLQ